jgi:hypothetical protein
MVVTASEIATVKGFGSYSLDDEIDHARAKMARLARGYNEEIALLFAQSGTFHSYR